MAMPWLGYALGDMAMLRGAQLRCGEGGRGQDQFRCEPPTNYLSKKEFWGLGVCPNG